MAAAAGMPRPEIALLLVPPITVAQLELEYALELEMGPAKANLEVTTGLLALARKGNAGAMIYWTKARMGWKENAPAPKESPPPGEEAAPLERTPTAGLFQGKLKIVK